MSQQGGTPTGRDDDWWGQLYDDSTGDTGPTAAPDSLDDRFASAAGTVARRPDHGTTDGTKPPPNAADPGQAADPPPPPVVRPRSGGDRTPPAAPYPSAERNPPPAADRPPWWAPAEPLDIPGPRTAPSA
ncbi:hypothetical protein ACFW48_27035, partial [Streptomyces sp. NPDC058812]